MTSSLYIVGCGGFGREVHEIVMAINAVSQTWEMAGFIDDTPSGSNLCLVSRRGSRVVGGLDKALDLRPGHFVVGIGSGHLRESIAKRLEVAGWTPATLVHPTASLGHDVEMGPGTVICAGAKLTTNIRVGRHVHIDQGVTVGHDCDLHDFTRLNPQSCISGSVTIHTSATIGAGAVILQGLVVGSGALVGAGSVVTGNVPAGDVVKGVPAR